MIQNSYFRLWNRFKMIWIPIILEQPSCHRQSVRGRWTFLASSTWLCLRIKAWWVTESHNWNRIILSNHCIWKINPSLFFIWMSKMGYNNMKFENLRRLRFQLNLLLLWNEVHIFTKHQSLFYVLRRKRFM